MPTGSPRIPTNPLIDPPDPNPPCHGAVPTAPPLKHLLDLDPSDLTPPFGAACGAAPTASWRSAWEKWRGTRVAFERSGAGYICGAVLTASGDLREPWHSLSVADTAGWMQGHMIGGWAQHNNLGSSCNMRLYLTPPTTRVTKSDGGGVIRCGKASAQRRLERALCPCF